MFIQAPSTHNNTGDRFFLQRTVDGCGMGNPLSPVMANIFVVQVGRRSSDSRGPIFQRSIRG